MLRIEGADKRLRRNGSGKRGHQVSELKFGVAGLLRGVAKQRRQRQRRHAHANRAGGCGVPEGALEASEGGLEGAKDFGESFGTPSTEVAKAKARIEVLPLNYGDESVGAGCVEAF